MNNWFRTDLIRGFADMHIPNREGFLDKYDPAVYAENMKRAGAQAVYIYGSNCLGLSMYPSNVGTRHIAGERDIFGQTVAECKKRGLHVIGYLNSWNTDMATNRPDWSVRNSKGVGDYEISRFGCPCPNNDEYVEYFLTRVKELVSNYDIDGFWADMVGVWTPVCFCESCQRKYREKYGRELPRTINFNDPEFVEYLHFKSAFVAEYTQKIRDTVKSIKPEVTVAIQSAPIRNPNRIGAADPRFYSASDYLSGDFYTDREGVNVFSRIYYRMSENLPFEYMTSRCRGLAYHTMNKDVEELTAQAFAAIMNKGAFFFIDAVDPDGCFNADLYTGLSKLTEEITPYLAYADYEEQPLRDVAVYYNFNSVVAEGQDGACVDTMNTDSFNNRLKRIAQALNTVHVDYDIITKKNLDSIANYKVLILPALDMLSVEECDALRVYIRNGGRAYISGKTSLKDISGRKQANFMLSDVLGLDYEGVFPFAPNYMAPVDAYKDLFGGYSRKYPHMMDNALLKVRATSGETLATVTLPISSREDFHVYSSALSDPPITETAYPAIHENTYGSGRVIYCAGNLEDHILPDHIKLFGSLVLRLLNGEAAVTLTAPPCVDHTVFRGENHLRVYLLNYQSFFPPIPITDIPFSIDLAGRTVKNVTDISGGKVSWTVADGKIHIHTDLNKFKLLHIDLA